VYQGSIYYAAGRISVLGKNALDPAKLERLIVAPQAEVQRVLAEIGWPESVDFEMSAAEHFGKACALIRDLSTDDGMVTCFLLRYDILNLKTLLKARSLSREAGELSRCGMTPVDELRRMVVDRKYDALGPVLKPALDSLEKRLAVKPDPLDIDVTLDKALYAAVFKILSPSQKTAIQYFREKADFANGVMALRSLHAGRTAAFISGMLLPGGSIGAKAWEKAFTKPEKIPLLLRRYGSKVFAAAIAGQMDAGKLAGLERAADDRLLGLYKPFHRVLQRDEVLIGYLLMREREAAAVRLILAGKANNFPVEAIRERLRELYAG
jgi:V/A-type H+/Na+-transporting ATPase subunit C